MKAPLPLWRMTRHRYEKLVEHGLLGPGDRVELLDGVLVARQPQGGRHAMAVGLVRVALERAFGTRYHVREEKPVALDDLSEPEPDIVVVRGRLRDYPAHPARPVLVVEVADSSLALDRLRKGGLYARAGLVEYWIVNLVDEVLEVYRDPVRAPASESRHCFRDRERPRHVYGEAARVAPASGARAPRTGRREAPAPRLPRTVPRASLRFRELRGASRGLRDASTGHGGP